MTPDRSTPSSAKGTGDGLTVSRPDETPSAAVSARRLEAVVIGASSGAIAALSILLPALPRDFPWPIFIVVHVPASKQTMLAELFTTCCRLRTKEAEDKEPIQGGTIYFAAPDYHLLVEPGGCLSLSSDAPVFYSRPSIDVLFESAADAYGAGLLAIILSGANSDGATGTKAVVDAGGRALVQAPETAESPQMPQAALAACPRARALTLENIAAELCAAAEHRKDFT